MIPEILLIWSCTSGSSCSEVSDTYHKYNPSLRQMIKNTEVKAKNTVDEYAPAVFVEYFVPILALARNGGASIKVTDSFLIKVSQNNTGFVYLKTF